MFLDSKSAIDMSFDPVAFKKTKHILRDANFLRDTVARELFKPEHVSSSEERADIMTKAVPRPIFLHLRPHLVVNTEIQSPKPLNLRGGGPAYRTISIKIAEDSR